MPDMDDPEVGACDWIVARFVWGGMKCYEAATVKVLDGDEELHWVCPDHLVLWVIAQDQRKKEGEINGLPSTQEDLHPD